MLQHLIANFRFELAFYIAERKAISITCLNISRSARAVIAGRGDAALTRQSAKSAGRGGTLNDVVLHAIAQHACHVAGAGR